MRFFKSKIGRFQGNRYYTSDDVFCQDNDAPVSKHWTETDAAGNPIGGVPIDEVKAQIAHLERELKRLTDMVADGSAVPSVMVAINERQAKLDALMAELAAKDPKPEKPAKDPKPEKPAKDPKPEKAA